MTRKFLFALLAAAGLALAACTQKAHWRTDDIDGLMPRLAFNMTDDAGQPATGATYLGKTVLLYFGYTSCPDVCPTTLAKLAQALKDTKDHGANAKVLFVTVDPKRDTLSRLHEYVRAFGPWFVGLRGTPEELQALTKRYRVTYSYGKPDKDGNYEVTHSTAVFVFDGSGRSRLLMLPRDSAEAITSDLDQLAAGAGS
ncbi:MAG: SCO family protein [Betaproteobacteria bacterium]|nr:SCO family protein [Betaproteobacteria bacterium]